MTEALLKNLTHAEMASFGIVVEIADVAEMAREKADMATDSVQMPETAELAMVASTVTVLPLPLLQPWPPDPRHHPPIHPYRHLSATFAGRRASSLALSSAMACHLFGWRFGPPFFHPPPIPAHTALECPP